MVAPRENWVESTVTLGEFRSGRKIYWLVRVYLLLSLISIGLFTTAFVLAFSESFRFEPEKETAIRGMILLVAALIVLAITLYLGKRNRSTLAQTTGDFWELIESPAFSDEFLHNARLFRYSDSEKQNISDVFSERGNAEIILVSLDLDDDRHVQLRFNGNYLVASGAKHKN